MGKLRVENIEIDLVRKNIKNIHLTVYPPDGRVRLAVPRQMDDEDAQIFALSKLPWIIKQRKKYTTLEKQEKNEYITGESNYYLGQKYLLNVMVTKGKEYVELRNQGYMDLYVRPTSTPEKREKVLFEWYRQKLKELVPFYIEKWEKIIGVEVKEFGIKRMKTRWGTCNTRDKRIWINLELARKAPQCLEYIIVHEMVHLLEKRHNKAFRDYMNEFLPAWKTIKNELNEINTQ
ncbi:MAG TPA: SprT family zinc-dependent metalloprotease [Sedimentibacter sp.]|nr:M48 family metallopeptidase [Sedimentibacter sp.]HHZ00164.1 M48 family metallopeptidase [Tissierellia bacterium]HOW22075.1 SprT family zinc-dependent metalloprotease [Sedimentibacter sp.]